MNETCPVLTPSQREIVDVIKNADDALATAVSLALDEAVKKAAENMRAIGQEESAPAMQYFESVIHQRMYCLMCGADPDTLEGGNPDIAYHVIRNSQNIARHYWSADIEPYPPK
ncbi:hypothetical protein GFL91_35510 [Rhizobium leguminosarum bv. viciae]|uniref:Uncharacterized protein n=1 Tax=Rhizobium leguminosarum bv. viciae TaxID=387 RepID=A0A8I2KN57_RHILV|nr:MULTISPECIES: hypothetical protein [Rhizobium]MBY5420945.1 hypothetical protein [Rhizobium leguminosarum]MBY5427791.1 hypothetical protein [Rhizobium leguminosarum]MBY5754731.1 hypothetical protein [Rhizobium leguminosarum]MBY5781995.1 hypothetical protein [Rhizobium leguminosarum]MBY5795419.1 hypothetical protein [Rhizobium leguminosarum]